MRITKLIPGIYQVIPYTYNEKSNYHQLFDVLINKLLNSVPSQKHPILIHMLGIPGAGKTTFINKHKSEYTNYLTIGFDDLMELIPAYQHDVCNVGSEKAYNNWVIPARIAGYELLQRAIAAKKNIIFDHGGSPQCHQDLICNAKKLGYRTKMFYISCPLSIAIDRAKKREKINHRHISSQTIIERYHKTQQAITTYKALVDDFVTI